MEQGPVKRHDGGLVAAAGRGRGEHAADLADQRAADPQRPGLIEEVPHLRAHIAESRRRAENDAVVLGKLLRVGDRRRLIDLHAGGKHDLFGHQLRHALDADMHAFDRARAMGRGIGQGLGVPVGRMIKNQQSRCVGHRAPAYLTKGRGSTAPPRQPISCSRFKIWKEAINTRHAHRDWGGPDAS